MQNLPNITPLEIAVVSAAVAVLYVAPAALELLDARRRRRLARQRAVIESQPPESTAPSVSTVTSPSEAAGLRLAWPDEAGSPDTVPVPAPVDIPLDLAQEDRWRSDAEGDHPEPSSVASEAGAEAPTPPAFSAGVEIRPLEGPSRYRFRFDALHRAHLPEWPPAAVRLDPERSRLWQEAQRVVETQWATIAAVTIASPYPVRSTCLGSAELTGSTYRLHFLLFPVLWPFAESQAVAQAVLEVDDTQGALRGWVDALRESELTEDHRRAIHDLSGGVS